MARRDAGIREVLVAPNPDELPDDGVLTYVVVTSVYDLKDVKEQSVLLIDVETDAELLDLIQQSGPLLGISTRVLVGLPTAEYSRRFDELTWQSERVSYAPLLSEYSIRRQVDDQTRIRNMTAHDHERAQYTRGDGSVRHDRTIVLASAMDKATVDADDVDAEEGHDA